MTIQQARRAAAYLSENRGDMIGIPDANTIPYPSHGWRFTLAAKWRGLSISCYAPTEIYGRDYIERCFQGATDVTVLLNHE